MSILNPFTPSEIASTPDLFYGRSDELRSIESSLALGSVLIHGPMGIGKSSLLARSMDLMTGFDSDHRCQQVTIVTDRNISTVDDMARLVLDGLSANVSETERQIQFKLGIPTGFGEFNIEIGADTVRNSREGRHLAVLKQLLEQDFRRRSRQGMELLLIGIDEADKSPVAIARLIRSLSTHLQQTGVRDVRFVIAGVSPLHQELVAEDPGVQRAFNRILTLRPMSTQEADELLLDKLSQVVRQQEAAGNQLDLESAVTDRMVDLSGGHPHILQLLGSHLIQHEEDNPDGILALDDLIGALRRICYEDRGAVYASTLHRLENAGKLRSLQLILGADPDSPGIASDTYPTVIPRQLALDAIGEADLQWLVERDILAPLSAVEYGLLDEFLRVRIVLDAARPELTAHLEQRLLEEGKLLSLEQLQELAEAEADDDDSEE